MDYKTLLVHLELAGDNEGVLRIAGELAERFNARVIGVAAAQPVQILYDEACTAGEVVTQDRAEINKELAAAESQFRKALAGRAADLEWRCSITFEPLAGYIADEARAADLIITGKDIGARLFDQTRRVHMGDLAMRAGRPILLIPQGIVSLPMRNVFVGWKESREARRAVADALPLLKAAQQVTVLEVSAEGQECLTRAHVDDVTSWMRTHQICATPQAVLASGTEAGHLRRHLLDRKCDLLIAGAYGHNRLSEWLFGGVTLDVLLDPDFCVLISH